MNHVYVELEVCMYTIRSLLKYSIAGPEKRNLHMETGSDMLHHFHLESGVLNPK
jgi:hypothetical protein